VQAVVNENTRLQLDTLATADQLTLPLPPTSLTLMPVPLRRSAGHHSRHRNVTPFCAAEDWLMAGYGEMRLELIQTIQQAD